MTDDLDDQMSICEQIGDHRRERLVDDTDGVLTYMCDECGAEWSQEDE